MSAALVRVRPDTYVDSVLLMSASRAMRDVDGAAWATAVMGTEANLDELRSRGFGGEDLASARANDLVLAVEAGSEEEAEGALEAGMRALSEVGGGEGEGPRERAPRSLQQAVQETPDLDVALISVPGEHAALEAHKGLSAGLHVLVFSDNVSLDDEMDLKLRGGELRRFVMGPGAGTAMLGGVGLGFANVVQRGPVGVVAAAGTGAQEVSSLLDRWGVGVRNLVGVGGRDLSERVEGRMTRMALEAFEDDDGAEAVLVVSKPPAPDVAADLLKLLGDGKPAVAALIGLTEELDAPEGVRLARTLEEGVRLTLETLGREAPDASEGLEERVRGAIEDLDEPRTAVRGLFAGGTLCYEAMVVLSERLGREVRSNTPLREGWGLPAPEGAHVCLDLGEEEYTKGRPHPMIDPEPRADLIAEAPDDGTVGVILVDVVLGHGAHEDPASLLAPACAAAIRKGARVVAYVLGTEGDPQGLGDQQRKMERAGCLLAPTGARAALMAAAIASRDPAMAGGVP